MKCYFIVALISISLVTKHDEHLLMFLLVTHVSSLEKGLFSPLPFLN